MNCLVYFLLAANGSYGSVPDRQFGAVWKDSMPTVIDSTYFIKRTADYGKKPFKATEIKTAMLYSHFANADFKGKRINTALKKYQLTDSLSVSIPDTLNKKMIELDKKQIGELLGIIRKNRHYEEGESGCFYPHHTVVFVDNTNKVCQVISICLECTQLYSYPSRIYFKDGYMSRKGYRLLDEFFRKVGVSFML